MPEAQISPRSDSDVLLKELTLTLAEKDYTIPVLRMTAAAKWRKFYFERTQQLSNAMPMQFDENSPDLAKALRYALTGTLLEFPQQIPELIFAYAPDLPREDILAADPYDQEWVVAFRKVWEVAFTSFLATAGMTMDLRRAIASRSASSASSNSSSASGTSARNTSSSTGATSSSTASGTPATSGSGKRVQ